MLKFLSKSLEFLAKSSFALAGGALALGIGIGLLALIILPFFPPAGVVIGFVGGGLSFCVMPMAFLLGCILGLLGGILSSFEKDHQPAKPEQQEDKKAVSSLTSTSSLIKDLDKTNDLSRQPLLEKHSDPINSSHRQSNRSRSWSLSNMWNRMFHHRSNNSHHEPDYSSLHHEPLKDAETPIFNRG